MLDIDALTDRLVQAVAQSTPAERAQAIRHVLETFRNGNTLSLKDDEAALVVDANGTVGILLPHSEEERLVPPSHVVLVACALRFRDENWFHVMHEWFDAHGDVNDMLSRYIN